MFFNLTMGSTTTFGSGAYLFSVPVTPSGSSGQGGVGSAYLLCNGKFYVGSAIYRSPNLEVICNAATDFVGTSLPDTWASGNNLQVSFEYTASNKIG